MKKIFLVLLVVLSTILVGCQNNLNTNEEFNKLDTPKNLNIDEEYILTWDKVSNASRYLIIINGEEYVSKTNSFDLKSVLYSGKNEINVKAISDDDYISSDKAIIIVMGNSNEFPENPNHTPTPDPNPDDKPTENRTYKVDGKYTAFVAHQNYGNPQITWVTVTIKDDKIESFYIDQLQSTSPSQWKAESKKELGYKYGMHMFNIDVGAYFSGVTDENKDAYAAALKAAGKLEWFEQAKLIEEHFLTTLDVQVDDSGNIQGISGVSISDEEFSTLAKKAVENAKEGIVNAFIPNLYGGSVNLVMVQGKVNSKGELIEVALDERQAWGGDVFSWGLETKRQLGYRYGMHSYNLGFFGVTDENKDAYAAALKAAGKYEWFEQADLIGNAWLNNETVSNINAISGVSIANNDYIKCLNKLLLDGWKKPNNVPNNPIGPTTVKFKSVNQILTKNVFNKFTAKLIVNSDDFTNREVNIVFTHDFTTKVNTFVSSDVELNEELKELCMSKITAPKDYIKSYTNNEFVVITNNPFGSEFTTTLKVNESGVIESYVVNTSNGFTCHWQNKDSEVNSFIASVPNTNINDIDSLCYISAATHTTNALKKAFELVATYLEIIK